LFNILLLTALLVFMFCCPCICIYSFKEKPN